MKTGRSLLLPVLLVVKVAPLLAAQSQNKSKPAFEVASVKSNRSISGGAIGGSPARFVATGVSLRFLIREAYKLRNFQISGGPSWIDTDKWDIEGKADENAIAPPAGLPDPSAPSPIELMLQSLIEDRFQLRFHREVKDLPIYELNVEKGGPKIKLSADQSLPTRSTQNSGPPRPGEVRRGGMRMGNGDIEANAWTVQNFTYLLSQQLDRILINKTNLPGLYDFRLQWAPGLAIAPASAPDLPSIFTAVEEQLGLRIESAKGPVEVMVIDNVQKPAEN